MAEQPDPRPAKLVIDQSIRENRRWESVCLLMTVGFALAGVGVLVAGAVRGDGLMSLAGAAAGALFWPAFRAADNIRRANITIRLMEIPLGKEATADEAAASIRRMFVSHFGGGRGDVETHP